MKRRTGRRRAGADGKNRPRIRRSTVALGTFFVLTLALYLLVRPNPVAQAHRVAPPAPASTQPATSAPATPRATAPSTRHSARPTPSAGRSPGRAATPTATSSPPGGTAPTATPSPTLGGTPTVGSTPATP